VSIVSFVVLDGRTQLRVWLQGA